MRKYLFVFILIPLCLLNSCEADRLAINVTNSAIKLDIKRLDKALFPLDTGDIVAQHIQLKEVFGDFADVFLGYMLQTNGLKDLNTLTSLANEQVYPLVMTVQEGILGMEDEIVYQMELLEDGFKHLNYYFPETTTPDIVLMNSWFQYGIFTTDSVLAVGLDFFIGDTIIQEIYPPQFYSYMKKDMQPDYIAVNAMYGWLYHKIYPITGDESTLLDHMVYKGKVRYLLEALFPKEKESTIMNYSEEELAWCYKKQLAVWRELTKVNEKNLATIYEKKKSEISKWVAPGPFTSALSEDATDRMGEWVGLQMVRDFMRENPEINISEMLKQNSRKFLKYYNPKK